ncbi:unnamed protein product, partial [Symbiodinium sp. KB8]
NRQTPQPAAQRSDAAYVANLKQQMYLLELESSILKQHGAGASQPQRADAQGGPGAEFDRLVGQLRASWAEREDALVEALRVVKRDLSKHKQLNYSQQSLIDQLKAELQLLRAVKAQDDAAVDEAAQARREADRLAAARDRLALTLEEQQEAAAGDAAAGREALTTAQSRIAALEREVDAKAHEAQAEAAALQTRLDSTLAALDAAQASAAAAAASQARLQAELEAEQEAVRDLKQQLADSEAAQAAAERAADAAVAAQGAAEESEAAARGTLATTQAALAQREQEVAAQAAQLRDGEGHLHEARTECEAATAKCAATVKKYDSTKAELVATAAALAGSQVREEEAAGRGDTLRLRFADAEGTIAALRAELASVTAQRDRSLSLLQAVNVPGIVQGNLDVAATVQEALNSMLGAREGELQGLGRGPPGGVAD